MRIWKTLKREILFAEEMSDKDLFLLFVMCAAATPLVVVLTWLLFALGNLIQGI